MSHVNLNRRIPVIARPDVLVCGLGCAGTGAAIAAARTGASTMVLETAGYAGGFITQVTCGSFDGLVDLRSGVPVVGGIVSEFASEAAGVDLDEGPFAPDDDLRGLTETPDRKRIQFDLERFKLFADRFLASAGVRTLYHSPAVDAIGYRGRIEQVIVTTKDGLAAIEPRFVVDATGDADIAAWAGAPFEVADDPQPMSLHFRVADVEIDRTLRDQCAVVLRQAHDKGHLSHYGGPWVGFLGKNEVYVNATRIPGNGLDADDLSRAETQGREDAYLMFDLWRSQVPGFRRSRLVSTGPKAGVRETRRISGDSTLTSQNIREAVPAPDVVVQGAWWLDRHPSGDSGYHIHALVRPYDIGYGTMLPRGLSNAWVPGRAHSAESAALASSRVTVTAMGMGEAAGTAAGLCAMADISSRELAVARLQSRLLDNGAVILERAAERLRTGDVLGDDVPASIPR